jgi:catechol 2,3-dioxygenase-like lactoylglutathione lyase family enzyme
MTESFVDAVDMRLAPSGSRAPATRALTNIRVEVGRGRMSTRRFPVVTSSVRYIVDDVDAAVEFYRDRLGFEVDMHPAPGFAALTRGDLRLFLNAPGAGGAGTAGGEPVPGGWNRFQIETDGLDALVDELRGAGVGFRGELVEGKGGRQILAEDPSGNLIELFEPGSS